MQAEERDQGIDVKLVQCAAVLQRFAGEARDLQRLRVDRARPGRLKLMVGLVELAGHQIGKRGGVQRKQGVLLGGHPARLEVDGRRHDLECPDRRRGDVDPVGCQGGFTRGLRREQHDGKVRRCTEGDFSRSDAGQSHGSARSGPFRTPAVRYGCQYLRMRVDGRGRGGRVGHGSAVRRVRIAVSHSKEPLHPGS